MKISRSKTLTPDRYTRDPREGPDAPLIEIATNGVELDLGGDCETTLEALLAEREASEQAGIGMLADGWTAVTAYRCGSTRDGDAAVGRAQQRGEIEWSVFEVSVQGGVSPRRRRQLMPTPLSCAGKSDGAGWPSVAA